MSLRQLTAVGLLALGVLVPCLSVVTQGRDGSVPILTEQIGFSMSVESVESKLHLDATGVAGQIGTVTLALLPQGGTMPVIISVPVAFDAGGEFHWSTHLSNFEQWPAFDCVAALSTTGSDGGVLVSGPWGLRMRRFSLDAVLGLPLPSGGQLSVPMPGTVAPLFPVTWTAIQGRALNGTTQECLFFLTAVPGIEGVLPVN